MCYDGVEYSLQVLVVGSKGPALLGRNWLEKIKPNWPVIKQLSSHNKRLEDILQEHAQLFEEGLGTLQGATAKIHVDPTATPIFHKARPVPYALREKIEQDLYLKGQGPLNQSSIPSGPPRLSSSWRVMALSESVEPISSITLPWHCCITLPWGIRKVVQLHGDFCTEALRLLTPLYFDCSNTR